MAARASGSRRSTSGVRTVPASYPMSKTRRELEFQRARGCPRSRDTTRAMSRIAWLALRGWASKDSARSQDRRARISATRTTSRGSMAARSGARSQGAAISRSTLRKPPLGRPEPRGALDRGRQLWSMELARVCRFAGVRRMVTRRSRRTSAGRPDLGSARSSVGAPIAGAALPSVDVAEPRVRWRARASGRATAAMGPAQSEWVAEVVEDLRRWASRRTPWLVSDLGQADRW